MDRVYLDGYQGRVAASTAGLAAGFVVGFCCAHLVDLDVYQDRAAASVAKVVLAVVVLGGGFVHFSETQEVLCQSHAV